MTGKTNYLLLGLCCGAALGVAVVIVKNREKMQAALERGREARELAGDAWEVVQRARELRRPLS